MERPTEPLLCKKIRRLTLGLIYAFSAIQLGWGSRPDSRCDFGRGGKSGLHRAGCQVTPGRREPTESAAENIPPMASSPPTRYR